MSGKGETIKEFLVALGFDVSPEEVRKYDDFISGATKKMTGFAEIATEAGFAIQASVTLIGSAGARPSSAAATTG